MNNVQEDAHKVSSIHRRVEGINILWESVNRHLCVFEQLFHKTLNPLRRREDSVVSHPVEAVRAFRKKSGRNNRSSPSPSITHNQALTSNIVLEPAANDIVYLLHKRPVQTLGRWQGTHIVKSFPNCINFGPGGSRGF